jgi:flavin reductase (DIM6/NTAB) family NADH-FMN oxidoreductase RutF
MIDAKTFREALGKFAAGVTVITVRTNDGRDWGMTATAFSSLSLDPPLVLFCVTKGTQMDQYAAVTNGFAVSILADDQEALSHRFANVIVEDDGRFERWPEDRDKFADLDLDRAETSGAAILRGALVGLDCTMVEQFDGGDHTIVIGRVEHADVVEDNAPLLYWSGGYQTLAGDE